MANAKFVKTAAAVALGTSVVATAVAPSASAATTYKIKSGKLVNAKTGKVVKGYKTYKSVLYKDGKKYTGLRSGKFYKKGVLATGTYKGVKYKKGAKFTGVSTNGKFYKNGVVGTGTYKGVKYKKGVKFTGVSTNGKYYENGVVATGTKLVEGTLYTDGVKDTKTQVFEDTLFVEGVQATADQVFEDTLYVAGKIPTAELTKFEEKYYDNKGKLANGEFTVDGEKVSLKDGVIADAKITSVTALNTKELKVSFSKEVTKLTDVALTDKDGNKIYFKEAKLAEDKKSATIVLYDALKSGETYNVVAKADDKDVKGSLQYVIGAPQSVKLASQTLKEDKKVAYEITDENGVNIANALPTGYTVSLESDKDVFTLKNGEITSTLPAGESAFLKVVVKGKDGKVVAESDRVTVSVASEGTLKGFGTEWTLGDNNFDNKEYKQVTTVALDGTATLSFNTVDQYGKTAALNGATIEYTSLNPEVAVVDQKTGKVTPVKEGTAVVRATLNKDGKVLDTKTVEFKVTAKAVLTSIALDKDIVKVTKGTKGTDVTVTGADQFGNKAVLPAVTAESADVKVATVSVKDNVVTVTPVAEGTTTVTVKVGEFTKTITVNVNEFGTLVDYSLEGAKAELTSRDITETKDIDETKMVLSVFGKDANGTLAPSASKAAYTVTDKDNKVVKAGEGNSFTIDSADYKSGETYTVTAKVGTLTVATKTFKVVDNAVAPTVSFKDNKFTTTSADTTVLDAVKSLVEAKAADKDAKVTVTDVKYVSNNSAVIGGTTGAEKAKADGTAMLYISELTVKVDGAKNAQENGTFVITVSNQAVAFTSTAQAVAKKAAATKKVEDAKAAVATAETAKTAADKALEDAKAEEKALAAEATEEEKAAATKKVEEAQATAKKAAEAVATAEAALKTAQDELDKLA